MSSRDPLSDNTVDADPIGSPSEHITSAPDDRPGGPVRYELGEQLGRGGMADVVLGRDVQLGREVAIKRLRDSGGSVARFLREAKIQGRLEHPSIVPIHELANDEQGRPYIVMKRVNGTTLATILAAERLVSAINTRLLRAFVDVCLAIELAHSRNVVHCDLKPSNIMLGDYGEVYVLDWGIAQVLGDEAAQPWAGSAIGTPAYMSPEQATGQPVDVTTDVYALGCILFEILAGAPLFTMVDGVQRPCVVDRRPSSLATERTVPPELEAAVVRATAPRGERLASARELAEIVERFLDGDRDLAQRKRLAREHVAFAREVLVSGRTLDEDQRRTVMQHAGRALALDPTDPESAALIGRLTLDPPREPPEQVRAQLANLDEVNLRALSRTASYAYLVYLAFVPAILWVGVTEPAYVVAVAALCMANLGFARAIARRTASVPRGYLLMIIAANAALVFVMARMFTSLVVAPGLACGTMLAFSMHARFGNTWVLALVFWLATIGPWLGELVGVIAHKSTAIVDGTLRLTSGGGEFLDPNLQIGHALYVAALIVVVGLLTRELSRNERRARSEALVVAWHLESLMPTTSQHRGPSRSISAT